MSNPITPAALGGLVPSYIAAHDMRAKAVSDLAMADQAIADRPEISALTATWHAAMRAVADATNAAKADKDALDDALEEARQDPAYLRIQWAAQESLDAMAQYEREIDALVPAPRVAPLSIDSGDVRVTWKKSRESKAVPAIGSDAATTQLLAILDEAWGDMAMAIDDGLYLRMRMALVDRMNLSGPWPRPIKALSSDPGTLITIRNNANKEEPDVL